MVWNCDLELMPPRLNGARRPYDWFANPFADSCPFVVKPIAKSRMNALPHRGDSVLHLVMPRKSSSIARRLVGLYNARQRID
jgi:hypothetical protein